MNMGLPVYLSKTIYKWDTKESNIQPTLDPKYRVGHWPKFYYNKKQEILSRLKHLVSEDPRFLYNKEEIKSIIEDIADPFINTYITLFDENEIDGFVDLREYLQGLYEDCVEYYNKSRS